MKNVLSIIVAVVMFAALASAVDPPACAPGWEVGACGCTLNVAGNYTINASGLTSDGSDCITISANDVTLDCQQHTITGNGTSGNGIDLQYLDGVTVENCSITDFYNGIYLYSFFDFYHDTLIGNTITSSHNTGIYVHGTGNNITGNTLTDNNCPAIYVDNADNNSITGNTLSSNSEGIELVASEGNVITGNTAGPDNGDGISLIDSAGNNFTGNTATGNDGYDFYCNSQDTNIDGGSNACDNRDSCRWVQSCGFSTFVVNKTSPACTAANGGGYFNTITGAVSAANGSNGDHIIVCNGTYDESIAIDKEVNIIGESRAGVITGTFYIHDSSYASVSNLTISPDYRVLDVERADHVAVSNITVDGDVSFAHFV